MEKFNKLPLAERQKKQWQTVLTYGGLWAAESTLGSTFRSELLYTKLPGIDGKPLFARGVQYPYTFFHTPVRTGSALQTRQAYFMANPEHPDPLKLRRQLAIMGYKEHHLRSSAFAFGSLSSIVGVGVGIYIYYAFPTQIAKLKEILEVVHKSQVVHELLNKQTVSIKNIRRDLLGAFELVDLDHKRKYQWHGF